MFEIKQISIKTGEKAKESVKGKLLLNPWVSKALEAKQELEIAEEMDTLDATVEETSSATESAQKEKRHLQMRMNISMKMIEKIRM